MGKQVRRKNKKFNMNETYFDVMDVSPLTETQENVFNEFNKGQHLFLHGVAGTGKTFLSCYLASKELLNTPSDYRNITVVRSCVPTRDIGFLPGTEKEKTEIYEMPYKIIFNELFQRGDAYELLRKKNIVEFISTSFIRGTTLEDRIVIVDECQNMNFHELDSVITRMGDNCKVIFCGDFRQSDLSHTKEKEGINTFIDIVKDIPDFSFIEFNEDDIVRGDLVKSYILEKLRHGIV